MSIAPLTPKSTAHCLSWGALAFSVALTACGKSEQAPTPQTQSAANTLPTAPTTTADGNTLRLQGSIKVNAGDGEQALQSHATVVDAKLGEKTAARLGTAAGQKSVADANARVQAAAGSQGAPSATITDVQDMANTMAGRTVYTSQAQHIDIIKSYGFTLDAKSSTNPGVRVQLTLRLSDSDMKLIDGKLEFYPDSSSSYESYVKKITPADVTIDKLERRDDKTFVMSGSFKVAELKAGALAKGLKGKVLNGVSGSFDFQEIPIRGN